jgi:chromosome segregation ATPase
MTKIAQHRKGLILGLAAVLLALPVLAADKPGKDQTRHLEQQLRAAQQEKNRLTQEKTETETKLKDVQGKVTDAEHRADAAGARSSRLNKELDAAKADIAAGKAEKEALAAKLAETERQVTELRNEKQHVEVALTGHKKALGDCQARNARMYDLGNELLDKYEHKGCFASVLQAEPFTGLKRAQIEKMVEADREKFDKEQILPTSGAEAAAPPR